MPAAVRPGSETGTTIRQKTPNGEAPSTSPAHSSSTGTPSKKPMRIQMRKGRLRAA